MIAVFDLAILTIKNFNTTFWFCFNRNKFIVKTMAMFSFFFCHKNFCFDYIFLICWQAKLNTVFMFAAAVIPSVMKTFQLFRFG